MNNIEILRITELPEKIIFQCFGDKNKNVKINSDDVNYIPKIGECLFENNREYFYFSVPKGNLKFKIDNAAITFGRNVQFANYVTSGFHTLNTKVILRKNNDFEVLDLSDAKKEITSIKLNQFAKSSMKTKVNWVLVALFSRRSKHWILSDRIDKSDDNAMWFAKYLSNNTNEKLYYAISFSKTNPTELEELKKQFRLLNLDDANKTLLLSKYKQKMLSAKFILSSHTEDCLYGFNFSGNNYFKHLRKYKYVFLQHGVMMSKVESDWLSGLSSKRDIWKIITSNEKENASFENRDLYHRFDNWTIKSGLPRFEFLENIADTNTISLFPTWRKYENEEEKETILTNIYNGWMPLLKNKEFKDFLITNNYRCDFILHHELQELATKFKSFENNVIKIKTSSNVNYHEQNKITKIAITDYSSAIIDTHFLNKQIVYYRFDKLKNHHGELLFEPLELNAQNAKNISELLSILKKNKNSIDNSNFYFRKNHQSEFLYNELLECYEKN